MSLMIRTLAIQTPKFTQPASQVSVQMKQVANLAGNIAKRGIHIPPRPPIYHLAPAQRFNVSELTNQANDYLSEANFGSCVLLCDKILQATSQNRDEILTLRNCAIQGMDGTLPGF